MLQVPPFTTDLRKRAIAAAQESNSTSELHAMVASIHDHRKTLLEQLASLRVQDMLAISSAPTLPVVLSAVRSAARVRCSRHAHTANDFGNLIRFPICP